MSSDYYDELSCCLFNNLQSSKIFFGVGHYTVIFILTRERDDTSSVF
jgi:hypothetical protein